MTERGSIYFIRSESGRVKIGYSVKVRHRFSTLQTSAAERLEFLGAIPGTRADEAMLHERVAAHRIRGEWFRQSDELMAVIAEILRNGVVYQTLGETPDNSRPPELFTSIAARWSKMIEDHYVSKLRVSIPVARKAIHERFGISPGLMENLRRGRSLDIIAHDYEVVRAAAIVIMEEQLADLRGQFDKVRDVMDSSRAAQADAALENARALIEVARSS